MIAKLTGTLDRRDDGAVVIDVGGVGYLVFVSARTADRVGPVGGAVTLQIETHVREDHIHLFGFADGEEQTCFRLLQTVQGVGAKAALSILSALSAADVLTAIAAQDKAPLTRADGVGPKLAQRIVNELKDKTAALVMAEAARPSGGGGASTSGASTSVVAGDGPIADAVSALVNLGYGRAEAFAAVGAAARAHDGGDLETLITAGLKELAS